MSSAVPRPKNCTLPTQNYLEVRLTATDALGLSKTVSIELRPETVDVAFATQPYDFRLRVNGELIGAPQTLVSWEGYDLNVSAPAQRLRRGGRLWVFRSWSDDGAREHVIKTPPPEDPATYTATFQRTRR